MRPRLSLIVAGVLALGATPSRADTQQVYVYPQKGQSEQQIEQDKEQCHDWAVKQTGVAVR